MKLHKYLVTLDKWASPVHINAYNINNAIKRALELFPNCDCGCGEKSNAIKAEQIR